MPLNFVTGDLVAALRGAGFDPDTPSFFSLLGVSYYLPREILSRIFEAIASFGCGGSTSVFDYFDLDAFDDQKASPRMQRMRAAAAFGGEPMLTGLAADSLSSEFGAARLSLRNTMNPAEIQACYFAGSGYRMVEHVHFAIVQIS